MAKKEQEFKLEFSERETVTAKSGLGLYGEFYKSIGVYGDVNRLFPLPGSGNGYEAHWHIYPTLLTIIDGGEHIEDTRKIGCDKGLRKIGHIDEMPTPDAIGGWLKRDSSRKVRLLYKVNDNLNAKIIKRHDDDLTLDIDVFEVLGEKEAAARNYKGNKSYMPMAGFIPETGSCIGYEFREGNESPGTRNYEFVKECFDKVFGMGRRMKYMRSDSAAYNSKVMNYVHSQKGYYAITADQDVAVKEAIRNIGEEDWKKLCTEKGFEGSDREYAEFVHTMNKTNHSFRMVVQRWENRQHDLFEESAQYCYHAVATNCPKEEKDSVSVIRWHNGRSNSENYNKELKNGFSLNHVPCGEFNGNSVWFGIVILAYNLFIASKIFLFPKNWKSKTIRTIRYEFIHIAGKVLIKSRQLILRICSTLRETFDIYVEARQRCRQLQQPLL